MNVGALKHYVTIRQLVGTQDGAGQPSVSYLTVAQVWADVRYMNGAEAIKADAMTATAKASIRIRKRTDVTPAMQVVFGATVFQIKAVLPNERDRSSMDLACEVVDESN